LIDFLACILFLKRIEIVLMMFKVTDSLILPCLQEIDVLMESKGGKKSSSSRSREGRRPPPAGLDLGPNKGSLLHKVRGCNPFFVIMEQLIGS
jgi:hypothetical protein